MIELLLQTPNIPVCEGTSNIFVWLISSFLGGTAFTAIVNGYFNVENTKEVLTLQGELKLEQQKNQHLQEELLEREEQIKSLLETNAQLSEERTSGFSNRMTDLEAMVSRLQREKQSLMMKLKKNRQPPMNQ